MLGERRMLSISSMSKYAVFNTRPVRTKASGAERGCKEVVAATNIVSTLASKLVRNR